MTGGVFVSYRREDAQGSAGRLYDRLTKELGRDAVFFDVDNIDPGLDFVEVLGQRVGSCDALLAVIGNQWISIKDGLGQRRLDNPNDFVRVEVEAALDRKIPVIPVLVDGARMPRYEDLPETLKGLARRQAADVSHARFDFDADRLLRALRRTLNERTRAEAERRRVEFAAEAEAAAEVERRRVEVETAAEVERRRVEVETAAEVERRRVEAEAAAEVEWRRVEAEAAAEVEWRRVEAEAIAEADRRRLEADVSDQEYEFEVEEDLPALYDFQTAEAAVPMIELKRWNNLSEPAYLNGEKRRKTKTEAFFSHKFSVIIVFISLIIATFFSITIYKLWIEANNSEKIATNEPPIVSQTNRSDKSETPQFSLADANRSAIPIAQRAALLVDAPDEPQRVKTYVGTVVWRLDSVSPGQGQPLASAVKADIDIPEAKLKVTMLMQKNPEPQLPASHTIEFHFLPQPGNTLGNLKQINVPEMRKDDDAPTGEPLAGVPVAITENYFLVGLSRGGSEGQNIRLVAERNWFDMSVLFASGKLGKLTFEKGAAGQRTFEDALKNWK